MNNRPIGDWLARFVKDKRRIKQGGHFAEKLFVENRKNEASQQEANPLSLDEHTFFGDDVHWSAGWSNKETVEPIGAAELLKENVEGLGVEVKRTDSENNPNHHVELLDWRDVEFAQREAKQRLASEAIFVEYREGVMSQNKKNPFISIVLTYCPKSGEDTRFIKQIEMLDQIPWGGWECVVGIDNFSECPDEVTEAIDRVCPAGSTDKPIKFRVLDYDDILGSDEVRRRIEKVARGPWILRLSTDSKFPKGWMDSLRGRINASTKNSLTTEYGELVRVVRSVPPKRSVSIVVTGEEWSNAEAMLSPLAAIRDMDWECLCVDIGPKDASGYYLDKFAYVHNDEYRFRILHLGQIGVVGGNLVGLDRALGDYVLFCEDPTKIDISHIKNCINNPVRNLGAKFICRHPTFSIIIPVYNDAPYLRECLDSVIVAAGNLSRVERGEHVEVICVDDGSTDGSGAILDEYESRDSRIRVIHQENTGVSIARNVALDAARGEWIAACDPDDEVKPEWLLHFDEAIRANPEVKFFWTDITCIENGVTSIRDESHDKDAVGLIDEVIQGQFGGAMWNKIYHRETVNAHGVRCPNSRVHSREDVILCCGYLATKPLVHHIPHADYIYKIRKGSLIHEGRRPTFHEDVLLYGEFERVLDPKDFCLQLEYLRQEFRFSWYDRFDVSNVEFARTFPRTKSISLLTRPLHHRVLFWLSAHGLRPWVLGFLRATRRVRGLS